MNFSYDESWEYFETVFNEKLAIHDSWTKIIEFHQRKVEKPYWNDLNKLTVEKEQLEIKEWIEGIFYQNPIPKTIKAFWIGIVKLSDQNDEIINSIYIQGSDKFEIDNLDWTSNPIYDPENKYGVSEILNSIDEQIKNDNTDYEFLDWILPLAYCSLTLDEIIRKKLDFEKIMKMKSEIHVVTGHDSGDYKELTMIR
jgi:hypothetical protein